MKISFLPLIVVSLLFLGVGCSSTPTKETKQESGSAKMFDDDLFGDETTSEGEKEEVASLKEEGDEKAKGMDEEDLFADSGEEKKPVAEEKVEVVDEKPIAVTEEVSKEEPKVEETNTEEPPKVVEEKKVVLKGPQKIVISNYSLLSASTLSTPEALRYLMTQKLDINYQNRKGETALHKASKYQRWENVKLLLSRGANPEVKNQKGETPMDIAKAKGYTRIVDLFNNVNNLRNFASE